MSLFFITIFLSALPAIISFINLLFVSKIKEEELRLINPPLVSVLIPARNEVENIGKHLDSLLIQDYKDLEIIILDDDSNDGTDLVVKQYAEKTDKVNLIKGKNLEKGWKGKNWASWQLFKEARGEELLFLDADVVLKSKSAISSIINYYASKDIRFLSVLPKQEIKTLGERLIMPNLYWVLFSYLPFIFMKLFKKPGFSVAIGTSILINKEIYKDVGGHKTVKDKVTEDVALAREVRRSGEKIEVARGYDLLTTRMYHSFFEAFKGLGRSAFPAFDFNFILVGLVLLLIVVGTVIPWFLLLRNAIWVIHILLLFLNGLIVDRLSGEEKGVNVFFYPFQRVFLVFLLIYSVLVYSFGSFMWKGREL